MRNVFDIFKNDLKSLAKNIIVFIVIIGISILPALYAWFNIAANWDPYSSTGGIPFAVCSKDKGATYNIVMSVNAGDKIIENLKKNDKMGWAFVSEQEAIDGVKNGTSYAAVIIPENFSENLLSVTTGKFEQAQLNYYINEKKNAITPKITSKGVETIEESINTTYVNTITTMIATTLNLATDAVGSGADTATDNVISALRNVQSSTESFKTTVDVFISTVNTLEDVLKASKDTAPNIDQTLAKAGVVTDNVKDTLKSAKDVTSNVTDSIEEILTSAEGFSGSASIRIDEAFGEIETNSASAAESVRSATTFGERIISVNDKVLSAVTQLQDALDIDLSKVTQRLTASNEQWENINQKLLQAADTIETTGALPKDKQDELIRLLERADSGITAAKDAFRSTESTINKAIDNVFTIVDNASGLLQSISGDIPDFTAAIDDANTTLENMKQTLENVKTFMDTANTKIDDIINKIEEVRSSDIIGNIINPIIENPQALGDFVSSPAKTSETRLYPVENYGSGMTPFYSSLAFWVGGIILVAVMRTDLKKKEEKTLNRPKNFQMFFGRYIIFFLLGQVQALIIALGDLFFLKVQCENPVLFIVSSLISSFVYTLIIYSLTITFSVIGKALAVIILVIQIAGAGGTFPIEVLPEPFRAVSPFLPFKYGVNLLREAVAGVDASAYMNNLLMLLVFVPAALILGLLLRKPCIRAINFFNKRIEQSDIVI